MSNFNGRFSFFGLLTLICLLMLSSQSANAQIAFGSVVGNVTDASGSAIPAATIKITHILTNDSRSIESNEAGGYTIATVTPGTYTVEITKEGFRAFAAPNILVNPNNVVRVDAQLQVGAVTERIEVAATAAALQTDRADIHAEVTTRELLELPQPNRTWSGLLALVPGTTPPAGQLTGGTNNPFKSMTFNFNGTGTSTVAVRIEGVNAMNFWSTSAQSYVPSIEAIETVNVATNASDAEQGLAGGASVNLQLRGGTNEMHGRLFWYHANAATEANNFFGNASGVSKAPPLVWNNLGGSLGGPVIKNKLFYFGSYEGDFLHDADSGVLSIPAARELSGDLSGSPSPIYDPRTGDPTDGRNRTPFANNLIPQSRIDPVVKRIIPHIPATNIAGVTSNYYLNRKKVYRLHKIDSKVDYNATSKLRLSARYGYQPYYNFQTPIYGEVLGSNGGFPNTGAANYLQHGAGLSISGQGTYVASPTLVIDATWGKTSAHQLLFPNKADERYGLEVLGIPGTNQGPLPWSGGVPNFELGGGFVTMGMSYPALEYIQPQYEYTANASKTKGAHSIRFGFDLSRTVPKHIELRENRFIFNGGATSLNGGPGANAYNRVGDFLLGLQQRHYNWKQLLQPYLTMNSWQFAIYARDQWQVSRKLTLNYGVRWEKYPVPTRKDSGIYFYEPLNNIVQVCGEGANSSSCGIQVSNKLFAPNIGIAYRVKPTFVIRAGYSLSYDPVNMGRGQMQAFPGEAQLDVAGPNAFTPIGSLSTGIPLVPDPVGNNGSYFIPRGTGNLSALNARKDYNRGYVQTYNFTLQKELPWGLVGQAGYVGSHSVKLQTSLNINYGLLGGGSASQTLSRFGITGTASVLEPFGSGIYHSLQTTLNKRLSNGLAFQSAYTYSKDIGLLTSILIPEYRSLNRVKTNSDRTHHIIISSSYQLPFGKGKRFAQQAVASAILSGWTVAGIFNHWSGSPFNVVANGNSCNCPGNTQIADQVKPEVAITGRGRPGDPYFDITAYRPVTGARFGTSGFNQLRGPGSDNVDMSIDRTLAITEKWKLQIRAEALNLSNTPHFANPGVGTAGNDASNANEFGTITQANPLGRTIDQRFFRFALRLNF